MTLSLTLEQLDRLLLQWSVDLLVLLFCLWVAARAIVSAVREWRGAVREGTPLKGEEMERNRKRGAL